MRATKKDRSGVRVFISHAAADSSRVRMLDRYLSQHGNLRVFSREALSAGENWEPKLRRQLSDSQVFVVLVSPNSVGSDWVLQEIGAAWALEKPIITVFTDPKLLSRIPISLSNAHVLNVKDMDTPAVAKRLVQQIDRIVPAGLV